MGHRVRPRWQEWELVGASGHVVSWIRHGVRVKFKQCLRPRLFNNVVSMLDANPSHLAFFEHKTSPFRSVWGLGTRTQLYDSVSHVPSPQTQRQPMATNHRPTPTQELLLGLHYDMRDAEAPTPTIPPGRLLRLPRRTDGQLLHAGSS
jgi:hypothetical protein